MNGLTTSVMTWAICLLLVPALSAQESREPPLFPVKAFCIAAPGPESVERFCGFIERHLAPPGVNTLILRIDFNFQFSKHPELVGDRALSVEQVTSLVETCRRLKIRVIPQVNLLGHQSWQEEIGQLLKAYPEFDETPGIQLPQKYKWPNADGLYCKSYCPQHPRVHEVVFACVDEICDAFEADAFHAGLDEVFYIGHPGCPRCRGKDRAQLFADEVNRIQQHLAASNRELWMWGDRLIDGELTGIGEWEASTNDTHQAIDRISKEVVICDWHYERANKTPVLFASKGFRVVTATWRRPEVSERQAADMARYRRDSTPKMQARYLGMMQTVWESAEGFMNRLDARSNADETDGARKRPLGGGQF
jgi:hypothetical protein